MTNHSTRSARNDTDLHRFRTRDVMCAPAVFKDELMGVVQVINSRGGPFQEADLLSLRSVSRFVAYALYHARLYDELATLKGLEKENAEFMRMVVHELRSPAAASKTLLSTLQFTHQDNPDLIAVLAPIEERMGQLLMLIEDILHLSRIKAGRPLGISLSATSSTRPEPSAGTPLTRPKRRA
jgi:K+-sensing histidine kinase KdpD